MSVNEKDSYMLFLSYDKENDTKVLFYEFDFYCNENADLDKHGDEIYKETE